MGIEKKKYSFTFDEWVVEGLRYYAEKQNRSLSDFMETIMKRKLEQLDASENESARHR